MRDINAKSDHQREWHFRRKDGSTFVAEVIATLMPDGNLMGMVRDISERKLAENRLQEQASLLQLAKSAIIVRDPTGGITFWSRGAHLLYGWNAEETMGKVTHEILQTQFPKPLAEIETELRRSGNWDGELVHTRKDGLKITVDSLWAVERNARGEVARILEINNDITARKQAERALRESHENLERKVVERTAELHLAKEVAETAARAKSEFLASMSHELRTPLNGIIGFTEFLVDGRPGPLNVKQKEYLEDVLNSGRHLLQLINDVLDLAKVEAGRIELHPESFPLEKAVREVCSVATPIAQKKNIEIEISVAPELNDVCLDQVKFKQVVYNLLSNALKFTDAGGSVEIQCAPKGMRQFKLSVKDNGIGIKPEALSRLFKEFEQIDSGVSRRHEGTGLGLALTRKIVEMQGGSVSVASEFGKGSTFTVILPMIYQKGHA